MNISQAGIDRIKQYEALSLKVYKDQAGLATIGYGHLIKLGEQFFTPDGREGEITAERAESLLQADLKPAVEAVQYWVTVDLTQAQFDSLVSFTFNCGVTALKSSSLLKAINGHASPAVVVAGFARWNKVTIAGKKVESPGLTMRRTDEARAWLP